MWKTPRGVSQQEASQFETICTPMGLVYDVARPAPGETVVVSGARVIGLLAANIARIAGAGQVIVLGGAGDERVRRATALKMRADEALMYGESAVAWLRALAPQSNLQRNHYLGRCRC